MPALPWPSRSLRAVSALEMYTRGNLRLGYTGSEQTISHVHSPLMEKLPDIHVVDLLIRPLLAVEIETEISLCALLKAPILHQALTASTTDEDSDDGLVMMMGGVLLVGLCAAFILPPDITNNLMVISVLWWCLPRERCLDTGRGQHIALPTGVSKPVTGGGPARQGPADILWPFAAISHTINIEYLGCAACKIL